MYDYLCIIKNFYSFVSFNEYTGSSLYTCRYSSPVFYNQIFYLNIVYFITVYRWKDGQILFDLSQMKKS